jgi:hypothetical protein
MTHRGEEDDFQADLAARLARAMQADDGPGPGTPPPAVANCRTAAAPAIESAPAPTPPAAATSPPLAPKPRSGRREKTILLGFLGTLAGAFVGVLSLKLLVPRPPAGAGPDVHVDSVAGGSLDLVDPPALTSPPSPPPSLPDPFRTAGLPAAPPEESIAQVPGEPVGAFDDAPASESVDSIPRSRFSAEGPPGGTTTSPRFAPLHDDGGLTAASPPDLQPVPLEGATGARAPALADQPQGFAANPFRRGVQTPQTPPFDPRGGALPPRPSGSATGIAEPAVLPASAQIPPPPALVADSYIVREGDSWWSIAEGTYGDGRMYKALFAWNRKLDPRVSATPGTRIEVPREEQLRAAWGRLVP